MDKTDTYIKMCNLASEIQQKWKKEHGDMFIDEHGNIAFWLPNIYDKFNVKKNFIIKKQGNVIHLCKYIWMPKQHQLIEMLIKGERNYTKVAFKYFEWTKKDYANSKKSPQKIFTSIEQSWLAYVMDIKYNKVWNNLSWSNI